MRVLESCLFGDIAFENRAEFFYCLLFSIAIFLGFTPFFAWDLPISVVGLSSLIIASLSIIRMKKVNFRVLGFWLLSFLYFLMVFRGDFSIGGAIVLLMIVSFFYIDGTLLRKVYMVFVKMFSLLLLISFVMYIIVVLLDYPIYGSQINPLNQLKENDIIYTKYPFLLVADSYNFLRFRFAGYFDEPGVVGTISAVCLLTNKYDLKKWYNIVLLVIGLFSMSLYFVGVTFFYFLIVASPKVKIIVILLASVLIYSLWDNEVVSLMLFDRIVDDGSLSIRSNRTHMSESWYLQFSKTYEYWVGLGQGAHLKYDEGGCSYKDIIIDYGVIFLFMYVLGFLMVMHKYIRVNVNKLIYIFVLFSVLYQRPFIENVSYVFLLLSPLYVLSNATDNKRNLLNNAK